MDEKFIDLDFPNDSKKDSKIIDSADEKLIEDFLNENLEDLDFVDDSIFYENSVKKFLDDDWGNDSFDMDELNIDVPEIEIETDDLKIVLSLKKDYSKIKDLDSRKEEFIKDLKDFINEFQSREELTEIMEYYDIFDF